MTSASVKTVQVPALVIGTGISGLFTALKLSSYGVKVLLVTKSSLDESNSRYAQGGIAAVLPGNPQDSLDLHLQDTIRAGAGLCDEAAARSILAEGYTAIADLLDFGVPFDRNANQELALTREAAHSVGRILHAGGDATGHSVEMTLIDKIKQDANIEVIEYAQVVELLVAEGRCLGCRAVDYHHQQEWLIASPNVILATGGLGRLYSHTTNPGIATGDGLALAAQAGARIDYMEFVQFHPTAFYSEGKLHFLVSEALRGEGGILRLANGERFAFKYHPDGELAPRDIVTRAIYAEMRQAHTQHVYLDITHLPVETIEQRFPTILSSCLQFGVDIRKDWIPVAPAAHYLMGGITVDVDGKSTVKGLYAVGETASTGLHGANRLASNSLLECVVLARRVAYFVAHHAEQSPKASSSEQFSQSDVRLQSLKHPLGAYQFGSEPAMHEALNTLHRLMWENAGILRDAQGLTQALEQIEAMREQVERTQWDLSVPVGVELENQLMVARLVCQAALEREESLGAHHRLDFPETEPQLALAAMALGGTHTP